MKTWVVGFSLNCREFKQGVARPAASGGAWFRTTDSMQYPAGTGGVAVVLSANFRLPPNDNSVDYWQSNSGLKQIVAAAFLSKGTACPMK